MHARVVLGVGEVLLGVGEVSCLESCPQFSGVLIHTEQGAHNFVWTLCILSVYIYYAIEQGSIVCGLGPGRVELVSSDPRNVGGMLVAGHPASCAL